MLRALTAAHMEGKIERYLKNITKVDVLIIVILTFIKATSFYYFTISGIFT